MKLRVYVLACCLICAGQSAANGPSKPSSPMPQSLFESLGLKRGKWISQAAIGALTLDSDKADMQFNKDGSIATQEDCVTDKVIRDTNLFLPGVKFTPDENCVESRDIAGSTVNVTVDCPAPDNSYGMKFTFKGTFAPDRVEGEVRMDGFHDASKAKMAFGAKIETHYAGPCS